MKVTRWGYVVLRSVVTIVVVLTIGLSPWSPVATGSAKASAAEMPIGATLLVLATPVEVQPSLTDAFVAATDGQMLGLGDSVRTGPGGLAVLTFFDGSETQLGSETRIQIERAEATPAPQIAFLQTAGVTMNHVVPMPAGGTFRTDTPAATGLVRGTSYVVVVGASVNRPDDVYGATSVILLTDRDGHVGRVDVAEHASSAREPRQLSNAGDAAASDAGHSAGGRVAQSTLVALEAAANARYEPEAARQAEHHARKVASALVPRTAPGAVDHPADGDRPGPLAQDEQASASADEGHAALARGDEQHLAERTATTRPTGSPSASTGLSSHALSETLTGAAGTPVGAADTDLLEQGHLSVPPSQAPSTARDAVVSHATPAPSAPEQPGGNADTSAKPANPPKPAKP